VAVVLALAAVERCGEAPAMIVQSDYGVGAAASRCVGDFFFAVACPRCSTKYDAVFFPLRHICPHSPIHWIRFEKCANTHLKAVSH
jgi:hypothetical protein